MEQQLFRFSILRGPSEADIASPIAIAASDTRTDDRLAGAAGDVASWLKQRDLKTTTIGKLAQDIPPATIPQELLAGAKALHGNRIREMLSVAMTRPSVFDRAAIARECDLLTAVALIGEMSTLSGSLVISDWIAAHPIVFTGVVPIGEPTWLPKQGLARAPGVVDHFVVRDILLGYEMGEIEDIKNYLKGEKKTHSLRYLKVEEDESVRETESETDRTNETSTQQRSKMSVTTQETANSSMGFDARVKTDGQYGPTKVSTDVGFQYTSSESESRQAASEFATDVVSRSVERVRERELQRITHKTRIEVEEKRDHQVDNTGAPGHNIGIYRWVDSVWNAATYKLGPRLILEFLIPEPGRAVRPGTATPAPPDLPPAPTPLPANLFDILDTKEAARLAALYGAEGIKAPPLATQVIGMPFGSTEFKDNPPDRVGAVVVKEVKIPDGYIGETIVVSATGMDRIGTDTASNIIIDVPGGRPATFMNIPGGPPNPFMVEGGPTILGRPNKDLRTLVVSTTSQYGPGATIPVTLYSEDLRGVTGFVEVHCRVSEAAVNQWKLDTIQTLSSAYRARLSEWESLKLARSFEEKPPLPTPDIDALCRHACISSMLGAWPDTTGHNDPVHGWPVPGALAGADGELIAFMEQAFEWHNLQYVLYPHYWANSPDWLSLMAIDHADPKAREFLRAGAARMVVPVPLAMTDAVLFFLGTGLPWFGGGAPIPGSDPTYLPIADEIRLSRAQAGEDAELIREDRYALPTALTILQEDGLLPAP
ncbi:hypothetical protein [Luteibacter sp. E-22]|uniref:hypothetical protein n=1 Tax=Luteibacter sp. E-22 TaxID=3404050 RepID=UPI003CF962F6